MSANDVYVPNPPPSECGEVNDDGLYIRGIGGGGWGGGGGGLIPLITPIVPPAGDASGIVTATTKRSTLRLVDGDAILAHRPETDWLVGSSRDAWAQHDWRKFHEELFGMPLAERLENGACDGMDLNEAVDALAQRRLSEAAWNNLGVYAERIGARTVSNGGLHAITLRLASSWKRRQANAYLARLHELLRKPKTETVRENALKAMRIISVSDAIWMEDSLATEHKIPNV